MVPVEKGVFSVTLDEVLEVAIKKARAELGLKLLEMGLSDSCPDINLYAESGDPKYLPQVDLSHVEEFKKVQSLASLKAEDFKNSQWDLIKDILFDQREMGWRNLELVNFLELIVTNQNLDSKVKLSLKDYILSKFPITVSCKAWPDLMVTLDPELKYLINSLKQKEVR